MMTPERLAELKKTFPWTTHVTQRGKSGIVQLIDCNGQEVPLFDMTGFLEVVTLKMATKPATETPE